MATHYMKEKQNETGYCKRNDRHEGFPRGRFWLGSTNDKKRTGPLIVTSQWVLIRFPCPETFWWKHLYSYIQ